MSVLSYAAAIGLTRAVAGRVPLRTTLKRSVLSVAVLAAMAVAADRGRDYWAVGRFQQPTDDAYVRADYTTVTPRLSGYVVEVRAYDNERVRAGQVLARIDDRDYRAALDQAVADVDMADAVLRNIDARITQQQAVVDEQRADIAAGKATLAYAKADNERYDDLKKLGYGSVQRAQQAEADMREHMARLRKSRAALASAERHVDVLASDRLRAVAQRERSLAARRQAELNLSYMSIVAPVSGTVGARSLRVGQYVQAGTALMAVVPLKHVYVVANYKETQLSAVHAGQPVTVEVDTFPGLTLKGHVDSLAPASGQEFSLLPADNTTGNFTKIVQRVPVRIALDDASLLGRLRPGMSVRTIIDTRAD
jgi:membrane fusion protein (multidrug efflux system)